MFQLGCWMSRIVPERSIFAARNKLHFSAWQAIKLHQYNLIVFGRNLVRPPPILAPEDEGAELTRGNSFKMIRDSLSAAASGWTNTDVRPMLGPVADNLFKSGVIEQASLLVVQDSESR